MFKRGVDNEEDYNGVLACVRLYRKSLGWALVVLAFLGLCVTPAYALNEEVILADQIAFVPNSNVVKSGWLVVAYNDFNAAVLVIGQNPQDYRLDLDVRAKLSNASTGGAFYTLVQAMNDATATGVDMPTWAEGTYSAFGSLWAGIAQSSDMGLYWCEVAPEDIEAAKRDYLTILHGGDLGGGGGTGGDLNGYTLYLTNNGLNLSAGYNSGTYFTMDGVNYYVNPVYSDDTYASMLHAKNAPSTLTLAFSSSQLQQVQTYIDQGYKMYLYVKSYSSRTYNVELCIYFHKVEPSITTQNYTFENQTYVKTKYSFASERYYYTILDCIASNGNIIINYDFSYSSSTSSSNIEYPSIRNWYVNFDAEGVSTPTPPNNWPENPTDPTPTPPTVPTPTPVIPSPYITQPTYSDGSFTVDLQGILDAMDEHCQHLQDSIFDNISGYYDSMSGYLGNEFYNLKMYLKQLFEWLASQMDFTFTAPGYNDSSVVSWLKRIYSRLGSRGVNTKPVDPVSDPVGIGDWFAQLMKNFIGALLGIGSTAVDGLIDELSALRDRFPFCIPWDIAAILLLLVAPPVAPAFDVPLYTVTANGLEQVGEFAIDLSVFDTEMVGIRNMETIVFAFCLAFKTDFFKGLLDVRKG